MFIIVKKNVVILFSNPDSPTNVLQYPIIIHWVYLTKVVEFHGNYETIHRRIIPDTLKHPIRWIHHLGMFFCVYLTKLSQPWWISELQQVATVLSNHHGHASKFPWSCPQCQKQAMGRCDVVFFSDFVCLKMGCYPGHKKAATAGCWSL